MEIFCPQDTLIFLGDVLHFSAIKVRHKAAGWLSLCTHCVLHAAGVWVCEELQINWYGQSPEYRQLYIQPTCSTTHTHSHTLADTHTHTHFRLKSFSFPFPISVLRPQCDLTLARWDSLRQLKVIISLDPWAKDTFRLQTCWVASWVPSSLYIRISYYTCQSLNISLSKVKYTQK